MELYLFNGKIETTSLGIAVYRQSSRPTPGLGAVVSRDADEPDRLLDVLKFWSQRQQFCFGGKLAWMPGVEGNARQVVSNAQSHQVITRKLLAGQAIACGFIHARNQVNRYRTYDVYHARVEDCATCPVKTRCLSKSTSSRRYLSVQVDTQPPNLIDAMKAKIDTEQGKQIYARRLGIVEPVFSNICVQKHMDRFTVRSKLKVDVQWTRTRFALVHNIGKIHAYGTLI